MGNAEDEDCNGAVDEGADDNDHDGFTGFCGDCNDSDPTMNPHATEVCDRVDNNCDGYVDSEPGNFNLCAACFDNDATVRQLRRRLQRQRQDVYRGAPEMCDGKLNNCGGDTGVDLDENGFRVCRDDAGCRQTGAPTMPARATAVAAAAATCERRAGTGQRPWWRRAAAAARAAGPAPSRRWLRCCCWRGGGTPISSR